MNVGNFSSRAKKMLLLTQNKEQGKEPIKKHDEGKSIYYFDSINIRSVMKIKFEIIIV